MEARQRPEINQFRTAIIDYVALYTAANSLRPYKKTLPPQNITPRIECLADQIRKLGTPEEVVEVIFNNPPTVTVDVGKKISAAIHIPFKKKIKPGPITAIPASEEDLSFAEKPISFAKVQDSQTRIVIDEFIGECKSFLRTPVINKDDFKNHEDRRNYESGIDAALSFLGSEWNQAFKTKWDYHRHTKNRQSSVIIAFTAVMGKFGAGLTLSKDLINKLRPFFEMYQGPLEQAKKDIDMKRTDLSYDTIVQTCKDMINFFADESNPGNESETRLPKYQRSFLKDLFIARSIQTEENDPNAFLLQLAENAFGFRIEKLFPFLDVLLQYGSQAHRYILGRIQKMPELDNININEISVNDRIIMEGVFSFLVRTQTSPNLPGNAKRNEICDMGQSSIQVEEVLIPRVKKALYKSINEISTEEPEQNSILPAVFIHHFSGKPITLPDLS